MNKLRRAIGSLLAGAALALASAAVTAVPVTQLGFLLDESGSIATGDFTLLKSGLASALSALPVNSTVEITVVSFANGNTTIVAPTVVNAGNLAGIQAAINAHAQTGGGTNTAGGISGLTALMTGSANFSDPGTKSIINLATDGEPNSQSAALAAASAAHTAGIDALSIEAIGTGVSSGSALAGLQALAFPGPATLLAVNSTSIPNPLSGGASWVVPVSNYTILADVLRAKVQAAVGAVPEPASLALVALALAGLAVSRRKPSSRGSAVSSPNGLCLQA